SGRTTRSSVPAPPAAASAHSSRAEAGSVGTPNRRCWATNAGRSAASSPAKCAVGPARSRRRPSSGGSDRSGGGGGPDPAPGLGLVPLAAGPQRVAGQLGGGGRRRLQPVPVQGRARDVQAGGGAQELAVVGAAQAGQPQRLVREPPAERAQHGLGTDLDERA